MFSGCESLEQFDFGAFTNYGSVWDMSWFFSGCKKLKKVNLSGFDTGMVSNMDYMFEDCASLTSLGGGGLDTRSAMNMDGMFSGCVSLSKLDVSRFETGNVMSMRDMFKDCRTLSKLDASGFDTNKVIDMSGMFAGCSSLTSLDLSGFDASAVRESSDIWHYQGMKGMFDGCSRLAKLQTPCNVPEALQEPAGLPGGAWYRTNGTEAVTLPSLDYSVTLTKKKPASTKPVVSKEALRAKKVKTDYLCGETVSVDDLMVTYYAADGTVRKVTDYTTNIGTINTLLPGKQMLVVTYKELTAQIELFFTRALNMETATLTVSDMVYTGIARCPVPSVKVKTVGGEPMTLAYGRDFMTSYTNNVDAGEKTAEVTVTGINLFSGTLSEKFSIEKASLTIRPLDMTVAVGDPAPGGDDFAYRVTGLCSGDALLKDPSFTCAVSVQDMEKEGEYPISYVEGSADAGSNYVIQGEAGILTVAPERVAHTVVFDYVGHQSGNDQSTTKVLKNIKSGSLIAEPDPKPADKGYLFAGWYRDKAYKKLWNFDTDTVQEDITLYACWLLDAGAQEAGADLCINEIRNQEYTGNQIKPTVVVYAGDASQPLKAGRDYTIKYYNNIEADTPEEKNLGGVSASVDEAGSGFTKALAYVVITGKGNYTGTVCRNFHIDSAPVTDDGGAPAKGFTLKYTEQMTVNAKKAQKPFTSLKYKKTMKAGTDYEVKLTALEAYDDAGDVVEGGRTMLGETAGSAALPEIPAGWRGTFLLTVTGKGNYSGTLTKEICVADKRRLMKNVSVTLGKNLKNVEYTGKEIVLMPAWYDTARKKYYAVDREGNVNRRQVYEAAEVFVVKCGKEYLRYGRDFSVSYADNCAVGTATMRIVGEGEYLGVKSVTFKIKGTAFNTKNITMDEASFQTSLPYTGEALTQNGVILRKAETDEKLIYGTDYSISYKGNKKKGTATMTFTAKAASGYSGHFKKTFKITAAELKTAAAISVAVPNTDVLTPSGDGEYLFAGVVPYERDGAKLDGRIILTDRTTGNSLREKVDYTVSYANNKVVGIQGETPSVMIIKGKGNYAGTVNVRYTITEARWSIDQNVNLKAYVTPIAYQEKKEDTYAYTPKLKVTDGKKTLAAGKDYEIAAYNCTQNKVREYLQILETFRGGDTSVTQETIVDKRPYVMVSAIEGKGYQTGESFRVDVEIYQTKLTQNNLYVVVSENEAQTTYTGEQVMPSVTVYYGETAAVKAARKDKITEESALTNPAGQYGLKKLQYASDGTEDYTLSYGSNVTAGKNRGSVTVIGTGLYGGSVTEKFTILRKDVYKIYV